MLVHIIMLASIVKSRVSKASIVYAENELHTSPVFIIVKNTYQWNTIFNDQGKNKPSSAEN